MTLTKCHCGKEFYREPSYVRLGRKKSCSRECGYKVISKKQTGKNNPMWKGDKVSYISLHQWVRWHLPKPELCRHCNLVAPYDVANISQEYKRDMSDWIWLCRKCHIKQDGRIEKFRQRPRNELGRYV